MLDMTQLDYTREAVTSYLDAYAPDYIGVSIRNLDNCCMQYPRSFVEQVCILVDWVRQWSHAAIVILGGAGFSLLPRQWLQETGADYGIVGDGCDSMVELLSHLEKGEEPSTVSGLMYCTKNGEWKYLTPEAPEQLDHPYFPSRSGFLHSYDVERKVRHNVLTKRGCALSCTYCAYPSLEGRAVRLRSPQAIADEIEQMVLQHDIGSFDFVDSVFNYPLEHAEDICRELIGRAVPVSWGCFLNPRFFTADFAGLLKQAGCSEVEFGIDSGSDICLRSFKKNFRQTEIRAVVQLCQEQDLSFSFCLLIGGPEETPETLRETLDLMEELKVQRIFGLFGIRILPSTDMYRYVGSPEPDDLLHPKFFMSPQLNLEQASSICRPYRERNPDWMFI
jgi:radical SAM superfamily enzyme YgiQ (UPF0313 family)